MVRALDLTVAGLTFGSAATAADWMSARSSSELNKRAVEGSNADDRSPARTCEEPWRSEKRTSVLFEEFA